MKMLNEWIERQTDQTVCWMVLRLEKCKIVWLSLEGSTLTQTSYGVVHWERKQKEALCWSDRESAYNQARANGGLLYRYDRGSVS